MNRFGAGFMTLVLLVATVGALPMTGAATAGYSAPATGVNGFEATTISNHTNTTNETLPPGALLSGIIGVQQAEFEGAIETRAFGLAVARAANNTTKANVILRQVSNLTERVQQLEQRKEALAQARANGSISNATYKAQIAELTARAATAKTLANMTENASEGLPAELLRSKGINVTAIRTLKTQAANLSGPEVAAIARQIAGPHIGLSIASERAPVNVTELAQGGPPGNETGPPEGVPANETAGRNETGPPEDRPGNESEGGNQSAGPPGNQTQGQSGNQSAGNETRGGSGDGSGNGQGGSGSGSGDGGSQGGSGSGAGEGSGSGNDGSGDGGSGSGNSGGSGSSGSGNSGSGSSGAGDSGG